MEDANHAKSRKHILIRTDTSPITLSLSPSPSPSSRSSEIYQVKPQIWKSAKCSVHKLQDENVPHEEKRAIANHLIGLLDEMEKKLVLAAKSFSEDDSRVEWMVRPTNNHDHDDDSAAAQQNTTSNRVVNAVNVKATEQRTLTSFSDLADVDHRLANLGDSISFVKNRILFCRGRRGDSISNANADVADVQVCRVVHRNFRRILQKESRFLRDELYAAKERIDQLKQKSAAYETHDYAYPSASVKQHDDSKWHSDSNQNRTYRKNTKTPSSFLNDFRLHPINFINIDQTSSGLFRSTSACWNSIPHIVYADDSSEKFDYSCNVKRAFGLPSDESMLPGSNTATATATAAVIENSAKIPPHYASSYPHIARTPR